MNYIYCYIINDMKKKVTLKQIAKELDVSVSTVSKALNDSPEISEPTKIKIQEFAKLKNYKPNVIGLNLKNRKTKTIGTIKLNTLISNSSSFNFFLSNNLISIFLERTGIKNA